MKDIKIETNEFYEERKSFFFTIITPVYNRRKTLKRTIDSVENQTFKDIEYIIIDDGSTENSDDIVYNYMKETNLPVMYLKKENGGVHTARNLGYKYARGKLIICIDSDDELLPDACMIFFNEWNKIPLEKKHEYWQIKARCIDQNGKVVSTIFPENINELPKEKASEYFSKAKGEQLGCRVVEIMKNNNFPEPDKVKFIPEGLLWLELEKKYNSWGINEIVRVYHTEGMDHLSGGKKREKKSIQTIRNDLWCCLYKLNRKNIFIKSFKENIKILFRYNVMLYILKHRDKNFVKDKYLTNKKDRICKLLLILPTIIYGSYYKRKRLKGNES